MVAMALALAVQLVQVVAGLGRSGIGSCLGLGKTLALSSRVPVSELLTQKTCLLWAYFRLLLQALPCLWPYVRI
jgi:hypothetical protein